MKSRSFLAIIVLVLLSSACFGVETVRTVNPKITVIFQEGVTVTGYFLKNIDIDREFEVELVDHPDARTYVYKPAKSLNNGLHRFTIFARDPVGNSNSYTHEFEVLVPGTEIFLVKPNPIGVANSTTFRVTISTSMPSVCKYTGISTQSFDDIRLKMFDVTGDLETDDFVTEHSVNAYSVEPGFPRNFYVVCMDDLGRDNFRHFMLYADTTPPRLISADFSPSPVVEYPPEGNLFSDLVITASEHVLCRYTDNPDAGFDQMTPFPGYDINDFDAYKQNHQQRIDFPPDTIKDTFTYYVQCMDRARFFSPKVTVPVDIDLTAGLKIHVVSPPKFTGDTDILLNLTTNKRSYCVYKSPSATGGDPTSYSDPDARLSSSFENLSNVHFKQLGTRSSGSHTITIRCDVPEGVGLEPFTAEKSYTYIIDTTPPPRPVVNATTPVCGNTLSAEFFANDTSGISEYRWQVGAAGNVFANGTTSDESVSVSSYNNGSGFVFNEAQAYSFVVRAVDGAGNVGAEGVSNQITYDATGVSCDMVPPVVTVTQSGTGDSVTIDCSDDASGCTVLGSYYSSTYQEPCNATQPIFEFPTTVPLFRTTIFCWSVKDNAGNIASGSRVFELNASAAGIVGDPCPGGIDNDGDGYGERCLLGFDCDDTDPTKTVGCANGCIQDLDGDGYGLGCFAGNDCHGQNPDLTTDCPNNCISDNDGDEFGLGCDNGPDCNGVDSTLTINCPSGCIDDNDGDGYGLGCPAGFDCDGEDYTEMLDCDNGCIQDTDSDGYGLGCALGLDCDGRDPSISTGCDNGCIFDEDGDGYGFGCAKGLDCNGMNYLLNEDCPNNCISDEDGDGYGWGCDNGPDCNGTDPFVNLDCTQTTDCVYDHDGDGYGLGCRLGPDCDDYSRAVLDNCTADCTYDEDCNGLPDEWQQEYFNDTVCHEPDLCGPGADPDDDGYTNIEEYRRGTDPTVPDLVELPEEVPAEVADADGDGMPDACERMYGLDPFDPFDADEDPDGDGLDNLFECTFREGFCTNWLNPTSPDTDNDGYPDGVEIMAGTDPCDPDSYPSAGPLPWILMILGLLFILGSTAYLIYKRYYVPLVSPPPKPAAVPRAARPAARPAGAPPPGAVRPRPRRLPPRRPAGPAVSRELYEQELKRRAEERERILSAFGARKELPKPRKIIEKIARKPPEVRRVRIARPAPPKPAPPDHVKRLAKVIGKSHFDKLSELSKEEADYLKRLAEITKEKEVPLDEDQVSKLASVTRKVAEDKEKSKELVTAFKRSEMEELEEFLKTGKRVDTFIKEAEEPKEEDAFAALSGITAKGRKGVEAIEELSAPKRRDVIDALNEITTKAAKEKVLSKVDTLAAAGSKEEIFRTFKKLSRERHVDKNVFEVLLSYLLKSGKITRHDVSEILFSLEEQGVLDKKDVSEVFFNLGIKK